MSVQSNMAKSTRSKQVLSGKKFMKNYAVVFLAWGEKYLKEVEHCVSQSKALLEYDLILITDSDTDIKDLSCDFEDVIRASFETKGLLRKAEILKFLPNKYDVYLFLDSDTAVIEDISLGFEKAEKFSIAMSPAPHYSLDHFWGFDRIMKLEGVPCKGQIQYNTGVIFFKNTKVVKSIFHQWMILALKYQSMLNNDQPFFSLAMEKLEFNPYTLSISYNYRGLGDAISGVVRVWHSHGTLPDKINEFDVAWPPRKAWPSKVVLPNRSNGIMAKIRRKANQLTRRWR